MPYTPEQIEAAKQELAARQTGAPTAGDDTLRVARSVTSAARRHGVNPALVAAVVRQESGGQHTRGGRVLTSPAGARGIMQLMPGTAAGLGVDADDLEQNIDGGIRYLRQQLDAFGGDERLALAAYNAGPGSIRNRQIPNYAETQNYVKNVTNMLNRARSGGGKPQTSAAPATATEAPPAPPAAPQQRSFTVAGYHAVRPGDTLSAIAQQYGSTVDDFATLNQLPDPNRLDIGQSLMVPGTGLGPRAGARTVTVPDRVGQTFIPAAEQAGMVTPGAPARENPYQYGAAAAQQPLRRDSLGESTRHGFAGRVGTVLEDFALAIDQGEIRGASAIAKSLRVLGVNDPRLDSFIATADGFGEYLSPTQLTQASYAGKLTAEALSTLAQSATAGAGGLAIGTAAGGPVGAVLGLGLGAGTVFGLSTYDDTYRDLKGRGIDEDVARDTAFWNGLSEAGTEFAGDVIAFGLLGKLIGTGGKALIRAIPTAMAQGALSEGIGEGINAYIQTSNLNKAGVQTDMTPVQAAWAAFKSAAQVGAVMPLPGAAMSLGRSIEQRVQQRRQEVGITPAPPAAPGGEQVQRGAPAPGITPVDGQVRPVGRTAPLTPAERAAAPQAPVPPSDIARADADRARDLLAQPVPPVPETLIRPPAARSLAEAQQQAAALADAARVAREEAEMWQAREEAQFTEPIQPAVPAQPSEAGIAPGAVTSEAAPVAPLAQPQAPALTAAQEKFLHNLSPNDMDRLIETADDNLRPILQNEQQRRQTAVPEAVVIENKRPTSPRELQSFFNTDNGREILKQAITSINEIQVVRTTSINQEMARMGIEYTNHLGQTFEAGTTFNKIPYSSRRDVAPWLGTNPVGSQRAALRVLENAIAGKFPKPSSKNQWDLLERAQDAIRMTSAEYLQGIEEMQRNIPRQQLKKGDVVYKIPHGNVNADSVERFIVQRSNANETVLKDGVTERHTGEVVNVVSHEAQVPGAQAEQARPPQAELPTVAAPTSGQRGTPERLYSGASPRELIEMVAASPQGQRVQAAVTELGRRAYEQGKRTFQEWRAQMREWLGHVWDKVAPYLRRAYNDARTFAGDESGSTGRGRTQAEIDAAARVAELRTRMANRKLKPSQPAETFVKKQTGTDAQLQRGVDIAEEAVASGKAGIGVQTNAETEQLGKLLDVSPERIRALADKDKFNAADQSALGNAANTAFNMLETESENMTADQRAGATANAVSAISVWMNAGSYTGRSLQARKMMLKELPLGQQAFMLVVKKLKQKGYNDREISKMLGGVNPADPLAALTRLQEIITPTVWDKIQEFWINGLLSSPSTHLVNIIGNALTLTLKPAEQLAAAGYDIVRRRGGATVLAGEAPASVYGAIAEMPRAAKEAIDVFLARKPIDVISKIEMAGRYESIGGKAGLIIRTPGRALQAADIFFRAIVASSSLRADAYRIARGKGLTGSALKAEIERLVAKPTAAMAERAKNEATYRTFTTQLDPKSFIGSIERARNSRTAGGAVARIIVPFFRTPYNILAYAMERTPLNAVRLGINRKGMTDEQFAEEAGRVIIGSSIMAAAVAGALAGIITGGGPDDREERDALYRTGWRPYSLYVAGVGYIPFARFEPVSSLLGMAADFVDMSKMADDATMIDYASAISMSIAQNLTSKTYLQGVSNVLDAIQDPQRYGTNYLKRFLASYIPSIVAKAAQAIDPTIRVTEGVAEQAQARLPFLSESLPARRDLWGNAINRDGNAVERLISPVIISPELQNDADKELARLGLAKPMPSPNIRVNSVERKLDAVEYDAYSAQAGRQAYQAITQLIGSAEYIKLDDDERRRKLDDAFDDARKEVRTQMFGPSTVEVRRPRTGQRQQRQQRPRQQRQRRP